MANGRRRIRPVHRAFCPAAGEAGAACECDIGNKRFRVESLTPRRGHVERDFHTLEEARRAGKTYRERPLTLVDMKHSKRFMDWEPTSNTYAMGAPVIIND